MTRSENKITSRASGEQKRSYTKPELKRFGSVNKLTCGGSGTSLDSETTVGHTQQFFI